MCVQVCVCVQVGANQGHAAVCLCVSAGAGQNWFLCPHLAASTELKWIICSCS